MKLNPCLIYHSLKLLLFGVFCTVISTWVMAYFIKVPMFNDGVALEIQTQSGIWSVYSYNSVGSHRVVGANEHSRRTDLSGTTEGESKVKSDTLSAYSYMYRDDSDQYNIILDDAKGWPFLAMRSHIVIRLQSDNSNSRLHSNLAKENGSYFTLCGALLFEHDISSMSIAQWVSQFNNDPYFPYLLRLYPYYIVPSGFILNTLFYGCIAGIWQFFVSVLNKSICSKCNRCPKCWYNLYDLTNKGVCPDCGWNRTSDNL